MKLKDKLASLAREHGDDVYADLATSGKLGAVREKLAPRINYYATSPLPKKGYKNLEDKLARKK